MLRAMLVPQLMIYQQIQVILYGSNKSFKNIQK